ncbi:MAG TPA: PAS domain-containing protein, partial [Myxococcota bacterium]|nr:PAS domain-containing protein [Myxococcota bacterium]
LHGVRATAWGWMPRFGWPSLVIMPVGMIVPLAGAVLASRVRTRPRVTRRQARSARGVVFCVVLSLSAGISTEYLLPLLEIPAPRVGALSVALASALMWLRILHASDDLVVTPHGLARAMLSELHDGVVLVDPAGRIQGCNLRFAEMLGQDRFDLVGVDLASVADLPPALLHGRLEERELVIRTPGQAAMPVSISSSPVCDRRGERVGMVVVFRDRLAVDALRRRLLASGRLAAVGELAAGIAHEVNNPIAFIRSDLNLLASHLQTLHDTLAKRDGIEPELRVFDGAALRIESSLESLDRVTEVVADVRAFAHLGGRTQQGGEASTLVESALRLARLLRGDAVTIELSGEARSARVEAAQDLKQVLFALLRVLVGESATGGRVDVGLEPGAGWLHVTLRADRLEAPAAALLARFPELDSGLGSADPGLAIAIELIERVGGRCRARADGADGLAIELALPLAEDASA